MRNRGGGLVVILAMIALLFLKYGAWLNAPNQSFMLLSGDGFKNYMTSAWHVRYDSSYVRYTGMNYPFGEHVLFTDNQPILSNALHWWDRHINPISDKTVGILNVIQALSLLFGAYVLFIFFRRLRVADWYAAIAALGLIFINPQCTRFDVHFGLSHTWIIPLALLLLCRKEEFHSKRYWALLVGLLVWFSAQIHLYFFGMLGMFITVYTGLLILKERKMRLIFKRIFHWVIMLALPYTLLNIWINWEQGSLDRPMNPYGFSTYLGQWEGVFLPYEKMPLYHWIEQWIVPIRKVNGETKAYIGALGTLFTLWILLSGFKIFRKDMPSFDSPSAHKPFLKNAWIATFLILLFSCGIPFIIPGMEWVLDYLGPIKQFRSLGRFTWAYTYMTNILAVYYCWNMGLKSQINWKKYLWWLLPLAILVAESYTWVKLTPVEPSTNMALKSNFAANPDHWINKVDYSKYQAILPLPYYHLGSENIWFDPPFNHFISNSLTCYHSGLPDMGVHMSRTPLSQTFKSIQLVLEPCEVPRILGDFPNDKPILLNYEHTDCENLMRRYFWLQQKAKMVYLWGECHLYAVAPDSIKAAVEAHIRSIKTESEQPALRVMGPWMATQTTPPAYWQDFEANANTTESFQGKGGLLIDKKSIGSCFEGPLAPADYTVSVWVHGQKDGNLNSFIQIMEKADGAENPHEIGLHFLARNIKTIVGEWALVEVPISIKNPNATYSLIIQPQSERCTIDNLMIRRSDVSYFKNIPGWIVKNNYWYKD